jgi:hypothetical protein
MFKPLGYQQLTSITAAVGLTLPAGTERVILQAEAQNVRWRDDGTPPTATVGNLLIPGAVPLVLDGYDITKVEFIQATSGAILNVSAYSNVNK